MTSRLPKSSRVALSLTVAVTAMAAGGSAYAQTGNQPGTLTGRMLGDIRINNPGGPTLSGAASPGGSIRNAPASDFTDQAATEQETVEADTVALQQDAARLEDEAMSADQPQAEADDGTPEIRRSRATYDSDPAEPE